MDHFLGVTLSEMLQQVTYQDVMKIDERKFGISNHPLDR